MEAIFYYIKKTICLVLCLQIILVNLPIISSIKMGATQSSFLNKEKSENDLMDNNSEEQDVPELDIVEGAESSAEATGDVIASTSNEGAIDTENKVDDSLDDTLNNTVDETPEN
jgi:hypothetical protein